MAVSAVHCLAYQACISIPPMLSQTSPSTGTSACCIPFSIGYCFLSVIAWSASQYIQLMLFLFQ